MATYSFLNIVATLSAPGAVVNLGYGAGNADEAITVAMAEDKTTTTTGADGSIMHSLHAGQTGTMSVRLLKTSPVNQQLSDLMNAQRLVPSIFGQNVITIRDAMRGDVITGTQMAFVKFPDVAYAKEGNVQDWAFRGIIIQNLGSGSPSL